MWLVNLVENLLSITRIEDGRMNIRISPQPMEDVVEEALGFYNRNNLKHAIKVHYDDELIIANIDARLIIQVITNLIDNAIKYSDENTVIDMNVSHRDGDVFVSVSDEGCGISNELKDKVFDMFYSGETKAADSRRSLGIGLALCRTIMEAHGGAIWIEDNLPRGTRMIFRVQEGRVVLDES